MPTAFPSMRTLHLLLGAQSVVIVLGSINRLSSLTLGYIADNEFLRWVDFINMIPLPLLSLAAFYLVKRQIEGAGSGARRAMTVLGLIFILGAYLLGASYGAHEVTNYLHTRFCTGDSANDLCRIIIFNDDEFSHWLFFIGFVMVNGALLLIQTLRLRPGRLTSGDKALLAVNALFIAAGIVANLAFEEIGLDLLVIIGLAALSLGLAIRHFGENRGLEQPLILYYSIAYAVGLIGTVAVRLVRG